MQGEDDDNPALAAVGADGSDTAVEAVTALQRPSRSGYCMETESRISQGESSDIRKHHAGLAMAAGAKRWMKRDRE